MGVFLKKCLSSIKIKVNYFLNKKGKKQAGLIFSSDTWDGTFQIPFINLDFFYPNIIHLTDGFVGGYVN